MAVLQQLQGDRSSGTYEISESGITSIGRHEDCDIVVESPAISRFHSQVVCEDGRYFLEDLNSRNGTYVNGLAVRTRRLLHEGDRIEFANLPFEFLSQDSLQEASGSWGIRANVVTISADVDDEDSVRRHPIQQGDRISEEMLGSDVIRENRLIATVSVAEPGSGWPVRDNAIQKLNYVLRLIHSLRRINRAEGIIARTLQALFDAFPRAQRIAVVMKDAHANGLSIDAAVSRSEEETVEICLPVVRRCVQNLEGLLYLDHWQGDEESPEPAGSTIRTIMAVPLMGLVGECLGVIQLDTHLVENALDEEDLERLVVMSNVVAAALEQARETEHAIAEAVLKRSMADADSLRKELTTSRPPEIPGYRVASHLLALPEVAGDFVDFVELPQGRLACLLIDVPGRGPAATQMMAVVGRLLSEALAHTGSAATALQMAQQALLERLDSVPMVISAAVMILDPDRATVSLSVAGHCPLYLRRGGDWAPLPDGDYKGAALGMGREAYTENEVLLHDDGVLLLFSDGITKLAPLADASPQVDDVQHLLTECASQAQTDLAASLQQRLACLEQEATLYYDIVFALFHRMSLAGTAAAVRRGQSGQDGEA